MSIGLRTTPITWPLGLQSWSWKHTCLENFGMKAACKGTMFQPYSTGFFVPGVFQAQKQWNLDDFIDEREQANNFHRKVSLSLERKQIHKVSCTVSFQSLPSAQPWLSPRGT